VNVATKNINVYLFLLFIIIGGTYSFGLAWSNFYIATPFVKITDSLLLFLYLFFVGSFYYKNKISYSKSPIKYYYFFVILFTFELIKNIVFSDASIPVLINNVKNYYIVFLIFPLVKLIKNENQVKLFINGIILLGLINGLVYYFQFLTGIELPASKGAYYEGIFRINHPGGNLMSISFFLVFARVITNYSRKLWLNYTLLLFFLSIFIITLARGFLLGIALGVILMMRWNFVQNTFSTILYSFLMVVGLFLVGLLLISQLNFNFSSFNSRMQEGLEDINQQEGAYKVREDMIIYKMDYILQNHPLLGVGFSYKETETDERGNVLAESYNDPLTVNNDSTYQNIVVITGYIGLLLWGLILLKIYLIGKRLFLRFKNTEWQYVSLALIGISLFLIIHGISSSYFNSPGLTFLTIITAFTFWIHKFALSKANDVKKN